MFLLEELTKDIRYVKGVGEKKGKLLNKLKIYTLKDLLTYFPFRYEDRSHLTKIREIPFIKDNQWRTIFGEVIAYDYFQLKNGKRVLKIIIDDRSGLLSLICFNRDFLKNTLKIGTKVFISSNKFEYRFGEIRTADFEYEIFDESEETRTIHTNRIVPVYHTTENITNKFLRNLIYNQLKIYASDIADPLPSYIRKKYNLPPFNVALYKIHFPATLKEIEIVRKRLAFDKLFLFALALSFYKKKIENIPKIQEYLKDNLRYKFIKSLPFQLTEDQKRVIEEIVSDMKSKKLMNRLLMGDVGSGKTLVAVCASLLAVENGYQVAFMVPTEILSHQHYLNIKEYLKGMEVEIIHLTGKMKQAEKTEIYKKIETGESQIIIGTHALIQEKVKFNKLALIVIDEQHRFGVLQRGRLHQKGITPDVLVMTATPIPRTLALTVYGELDVSVIKTMPPGRKPVKTFWFTTRDSAKIYNFLRDEIKKGNQIYVVYPLISESEKLPLRDAETMYIKFKKEIFPEFRVGLIHGQLKKEIKNEIMEKFKKGEIDLLVATTVIEVGVDVGNATVMVIENAERFGLAQLHQLRGRIGRGEKQSYCILVTSEKLTDEAKARMEAMVEYSDGFKLAEIDLKLRGPGELLGTKQTGLPELKPVDLIKDVKIIEFARCEAENLLKKYSIEDFPLLKKSFEYSEFSNIELLKVG